jgi:hypothetical protein
MHLHAQEQHHAYIQKYLKVGYSSPAHSSPAQSISAQSVCQLSTSCLLHLAQSPGSGVRPVSKEEGAGHRDDAKGYAEHPHHRHARPSRDRKTLNTPSNTRQHNEVSTKVMVIIHVVTVTNRHYTEYQYSLHSYPCQKRTLRSYCSWCGQASCQGWRQRTEWCAAL